MGIRIDSILCILFLLSIEVNCSPSCGSYGQNPCTFLPAPPGSTPTCAGPGKTYCEHVPGYPIALIRHLVSSLGHRAHDLIVDETANELRPPNFHPLTIPQFFSSALIPDSYSVPPSTPPHSPHDHFPGYTYPAASPLYDNKISHYREEDPHFVEYFPDYYTQGSISHAYPYKPINYQTRHKTQRYRIQPPTTHYNSREWFQRFTRDICNKKKLDRELIKRNDELSIAEIFEENKFNVTDEDTVRTKRQSPGRNALCQVSTQFIVPQAALNSRGNWMYVVNDEAQARQLVKAESCASTVCSNLCQLPNGYNSRCEQKYVQKRLIALQGNGQNLYTDTFWFPSCCVCTISN